MSYLVLARRYRPQTFEEVIGQEHVTRTLYNAIQTDHLAQAFLFSGTRGVGKTTAARILAKAINCQAEIKDRPCNQCSSCLEINGGGSVDVLEIDGASNTGVDHIRDLRENVRYLPASSRRKVYIIDEVHMLSKGAFNALLKTLEEPPAHVVFIFATTEVHKVPPTILSRCQRYNFRPIPPGMVSEHLLALAARESLDLSREAAATLARAAKGSMRDGLSLLDQTVSFAGRKVDQDAVQEVLGLVDPKLVWDLAAAILAPDSRAVLRGVAEVDERGYDLRSFFQDLLAHFRNLIVLKTDPQAAAESLGLAPVEVEVLQAQAQGATPQTLQLCLQGLLDSERLFKNTTQPRFALELALLKLCHLVPVVGLDEILVKLDRLKQGLGGTTGDPGPEPPGAALSPAVDRPDQAGEDLPLSGEAGENDPLDDPLARWPSFVDSLAVTSPSYRALLDGTRPVRMDKGRLVLESESTFLVANDDRRAKLEEEAAAFFGRPLRLRIVQARPGEEKKNGADLIQAARKAALEHPRVRQAMDLFEATPLEIKPLARKTTEAG